MDDGPGERSLFEDICHSTERFDADTVGESTDIHAIDQAARCINRALDIVAMELHPDMSTSELALIIQSNLLTDGVDPGMIIRVSPEEVVWHGLPGDRMLRNGNIVSVDVACSVQGWWADAAMTFPVGDVDDKREHLLAVAVRGVRAVVDTMRQGELGIATSKAIDAVARNSGVQLISEAAGHGLGRRLHEAPSLTYDGRPHPPIIAGMVYTVEPIFTTGCGEVIIADDGTAMTRDGEPTAHFELPVLALNQAAQILGSPSWL